VLKEVDFTVPVGPPDSPAPMSLHAVFRAGSAESAAVIERVFDH